MFCNWVYSTEDCQDIDRKGKNCLLIEQFFERIPNRFEGTYNFRVRVSFIYYKKISNVLRRKIDLAGNQDAKFHPVQNNSVATNPMETFHIQERIREFKRRVVSSSKKGFSGRRPQENY